MSIEAMSIVLNHSNAKGAAKLVLLGIANHINPDNDGAWPSQARLASYANISERSVRSAVEQLVALGELRYQVGAGNSSSQYKPNRYWLTMSCPPQCDGSANHKLRAEVSDTQGGSFQQSGWKQASDKPLIEPKVEPSNAQGELERQFELWYQFYPRKVGKVAALKAYTKAVECVGFEDLFLAVEKFAADPNKPAKEFLPHPATWLNEGRWDDEPYPERQMTAEEKRAVELAEIERRRARDLEQSNALREEARLAEERAKADPPKRCEHDRIKAVCAECLRKKIN